MSIDHQAKRRKPDLSAADARRSSHVVATLAMETANPGAPAPAILPDASLFAIDDEGYLLWSDPRAISHLSDLDALEHDPQRRRLSPAWARRLWLQVPSGTDSPQARLIDPVTTGGCTGLLFWSPNRPTQLNTLLIDRRMSGIEIDPAWDSIFSGLHPLDSKSKGMARAA